MTKRAIDKLPVGLKRGLRVLDKGIKRDMMIVIGKNAVDMFRENFNREGFLNGGVKKWQDVKRRDPGSKWYGFEYTGERRTYYRLTRNRKTGKTSKAKTQKPLNFSPNATRRKILTSKRMELRNSLRYIAGEGRVSIVSGKRYAKVQNEGGMVKVFGKHPVKLPSRQFMGASKELTEKIKKEIEQRVKNALNF